MISIRKRGQVYQYSFEIAKVDGKRKRKSKSGFKTKKEAMEAGIIEYNNYFNIGRNTNNDKISYSDYLDI
ncbi:MAG: Arm DNA-binding domain-containing protein [Clostridia bacterium]